MTVPQQHTHPRQTTTVRKRRRHLPRIHWGWYLTTVIALIATAQTWPTQTIAALAGATISAIATVVRPRRLATARHDGGDKNSTCRPNNG